MLSFVTIFLKTLDKEIKICYNVYRRIRGGKKWI